MEEKKLFLLDAMALIYRAFYALNKNPRINSKGLNTSAILGFSNTLFDVLKTEKPTHIGVAFDTGTPTLRHEGFAAYKAQRQETPEDLSLAIPYIKEIIDAFNIPVLAVPGYEADDVIGTMAKKAEEKGFLTYMMTPDKDFGQLVSEHTLIFKPGKFGNPPEKLGVREVCEKFGIKYPEQVKDILGIWGDASDNIPGIPGIGEKGATRLIAEFGSVEDIIQRVAEVSNEKLREKIITYKDQALMSKKLATIILDVPVDFDENALKMAHPDRERLKHLFEELEFKTFATRVFAWMDSLERKASGDVELPETGLDGTTGKTRKHESDQLSIFGEFSPDENPETNFSTIQDTSHTYHLADTSEKRSALVKMLSGQEFFCFDTETTGLDPSTAELVGMSFSVSPHEAWYIPVPSDFKEACRLVEEFIPLFKNEKIGKIGQNMKFDISILKWYGVEVRGKMFDTMLAHYLLQPDMRHNMDLLSETYLKYQPVPIEDLIGKKGKGQLSMRTVETETIKEYAAEDADVTLQLKNVFEPMLESTGTRELFDTIEMPLVPVLSSMEAEGVRLDTQALNEYSQELQKDVLELEQQIYQDAGTTFNIASPKQLGEILFDRLKIVEKPRQTKTRQYSTNEDILSKLVNKHPVISRILEYRSLTKLKSTYVDVLPTLVSPRDGRIHTSYNQAVAATGRLSSNNPNLQNIPIRTEKGREIRKAFVPRNPDYVLLSADYSQVELRIIAHLSGDAEMISDFRSGKDIHAATAAKVYGVGPEDVTKEMRRNAKTVNFGIIYGISPFGLSERLNIPRKEASEIINQYFSKYPGIKKYMDDTIEIAKEKGYVETMMKRRRYLRDIRSNNATVRGFAERNAINAPIQGTAADMIKIAMIRVYEEFRKRNLKSRMILQVHDELVFDVYRDERDEVKSVVEEKMKHALQLSVPLEVEISSGENWLEAH
ncbi:MAG: DNA polymerase I [Bacteroidota bacterium]|nr:DNA polymerase I [Bacteroidota bacterium]